MAEFDYYEVRAVITPGALALAGFFLAYPDLYAAAAGADFGVGDLGLFVILSYSLGHLVAAVGNLFEDVWWRIQRGWPSEWVRRGKRNIISELQRSLLPTKLHAKLGLPLKASVAEYTQREWEGITNQMKAAVYASERAKRLESFNSNYGLFRGIVAAGILVLPIIAIQQRAEHPEIVLGVLAAIVLAALRFQRFARRYSEELFNQFLQLE